MEGILGLLLVFIPIIMGLVGKKQDNSGKGGAAVPPRPYAMPAMQTPQHEEGASGRNRQRKQKQAGKPAEAKQNAPYAVEEAKTVKKDKLDPKKLVIYSEIMKPKF